MISPALAEYAESPSVFSVWPDGFRRVVHERYCLVLGPSPYFSEVQRPRLGDAVEETVAEIRALARESGHAPPVWWIGGSATPDDLVERLLGLGLEEPPANADLVALAIAAEPDVGPADVEIRKVETIEDYAAVRELMWQAFDTPQERREEERRTVDETFRAERALGAVVAFLALLDGQPVAAGRAAYCDRGGLLFGGCTLPLARPRRVPRARPGALGRSRAPRHPGTRDAGGADVGADPPPPRVRRGHAPAAPRRADARIPLTAVPEKLQAA